MIQPLQYIILKLYLPERRVVNKHYLYVYDILLRKSQNETLNIIKTPTEISACGIWKTNKKKPRNVV